MSNRTILVGGLSVMVAVIIGTASKASKWGGTIQPGVQKVCKSGKILVTNPWKKCTVCKR
jgi:hypothetical protein